MEQLSKKISIFVGRIDRLRHQPEVKLMAKTRMDDGYSSKNCSSINAQRGAIGLWFALSR